jgi:hypothetical protein
VADYQPPDLATDLLGARVAVYFKSWSSDYERMEGSGVVRAIRVAGGHIHAVLQVIDGAFDEASDGRAKPGDLVTIVSDGYAGRVRWSVDRPEVPS